MSNYEFRQYEQAEKKLEMARYYNANELEQAYDGIHPTRTVLDYSLGKLYVESVNPAEYAVYLVDLQEGHKQVENYWSMRAEAYKQAIKLATSGKRYEIKEVLCKIIASRPELQRNNADYDMTEDIEEYDKRIDNMSEAEALEGYIDPLESEHIKPQCIRLYNAHEMTFKEIGKALGITSTRAREIISAGG